MTDYDKMSDEELRNEVARVLGYVYAAVWWKPDGTLAGTLPKWSTSIADAWELVEQAERDGFWLKIHSPFVAGDAWHAGFTPLGITGWNGQPDYAGAAPTAPRAICLAFLQSKGK